MLRVTIDLVPKGYEPRRRTIASMTIANVSDLDSLSDYEVDALEAANTITGSPAGIATCRVVGHDSRQRVWALLERACAEASKADFVEL